MALIIKPDETTAVKKRIHFAIYDINGLITDHEAFGLSLAWAVDTFAPAASDLKVGADNGASANYGGTFAYRKNGEWYYEFSNAEVAASLGADTVYIEFYRTGYRSFVIRIPLRNDVESIKANTIDASAIADNAIDAGAIAAAAITSAKFATDAIDANALKADAVTEIQTGLATSTALAAAQTDITTLLTRLSAARAGYLDNLSGGAVALNSDIATLLTRLSATRAGYLDNLSGGAVALASALTTAQADLTTLTGRLTALRAGYLDNLSAGAVALASALTTAQTDLTTLVGRLTAARAGYLDNLSAGAAALETTAQAIKAKTDNLPTDPADESLIIAATDAIIAAVGTMQTDVTTIKAYALRSLGMLNENTLVDGGAGQTAPTYSAKKVLLNARARQFANATALAAATKGAADDADGEIARWTITGEDTGTGLMKSFKIAVAL